MIFAKSNMATCDELAKRLAVASTVDEYRRLKIIDLSLQSKSVPELAQMFGLCQATIRQYIHSFNTGGLDGLKRKYSQGCPVTVPVNKEELEELFRRSPSQFELLETGARNWTQDLLVLYFSKYYQAQVTRSAVSKYLKRHNLRLNRGKLKVTSPDPEYKAKRKRVETLKKKPLTVS